jgi:hypothetical protein
MGTAVLDDLPLSASTSKAKAAGFNETLFTHLLPEK